MQERFEIFTVLTAHIARSIRRIKAEATAEFGLKVGHVSCLYYLFRSGPLTLTELCELCEEDKANLSRSVDHLEKNGYITQPEGREGHYKRRFRLTEKGNAVAKTLSQRVKLVLDEVSYGISEEERAVMYRCLSQISTNLKNINGRYDTDRPRI